LLEIAHFEKPNANLSLYWVFYEQTNVQLNSQDGTNDLSQPRNDHSLEQMKKHGTLK